MTIEQQHTGAFDPAEVRRLLAEGKAQEALDALADRLQKPRVAAGILLLAAQAYLALDRREEARLLVTEACQQRPAAANAYATMAELGAVLSMPEAEIMAALEHGRKAFPDDRKIALHWSKAAVASEDPALRPEAQRVLLRLAAHEPMDGLARQAVFLLVNSDLSFPDAGKRLSFLVEQFPSHPAARARVLLEAKQLASRFVNKGDFTSARQCFAALRDHEETAAIATNFLRLMDSETYSARMQAAQQFEEFAGESALAIRRAANPKHAVIIFPGLGAGTAGGFLDMLLDALDFHRIYLRDPLRLLGMGGYPPLGPDFHSSVEGLKRTAGELGCGIAGCIGNSAGGYPAIRYGLALRVPFIMAFSPPALSEPILKQADPRAKGFVRRLFDRIAPRELELRPILEASAYVPRTTIWYGADNEIDRLHAESLTGLSNVEINPLPGTSDHMVLAELLANGWLEEALLRELSVLEAN